MRTAALAVLLVALAGCSGFAAQPTPTATPAPVPAAETPTPAAGGAGGATPTELAPGVTRNGVVDPLALANAHAEHLGGTYTLGARWAVRYDNGSLRALLDQRARVDREAFVATVAVRGPEVLVVGGAPATATFWSDGRELVERVRRNGTTSYLHVPADEFNGGNGFYNSLRRPKPWLDTYALFAAVGTDLVGRKASDRGTVYLLQGDRLRRPDLFAAETNTRDPRNVTLTALVDGQGRVRSVALEYTAAVDGETVHVTRTVRYSAVGETTVERPDWYGTAINESVRNRRAASPG